MMPQPPTLSFLAADYQRLAAAADQIEASIAAIQEALDDLGTTRATDVVRKCLAIDIERLEADASEIRWLLQNTPLSASSLASLQSVAGGVEYTVGLWRRREHLGDHDWLEGMDAFRAVLRREAGALLLDVGWIESLIGRQPAEAVARGRSISGWDVGRLRWSLEQLNGGVSNLRALAVEAARSASREDDRPRRLDEVANVIDAAVTVMREVLEVNPT